jgi:hypothetical protein
VKLVGANVRLKHLAWNDDADLSALLRFGVGFHGRLARWNRRATHVLTSLFNDILAAFTTIHLADALSTASSASHLHLTINTFQT